MHTPLCWARLPIWQHPCWRGLLAACKLKKKTETWSLSITAVEYLLLPTKRPQFPVHLKILQAGSGISTTRQPNLLPQQLEASKACGAPLRTKWIGWQQKQAWRHKCKFFFQSHSSNTPFTYVDWQWSSMGASRTIIDIITKVLVGVKKNICKEASQPKAQMVLQLRFMLIILATMTTRHWNLMVCTCTFLFAPQGWIEWCS